MDKGTLSYQDEGTPQGGVISPLLSNIYLHEVLDEWFEQEVQPRMKGRAFLVRYADDFVIGFEQEEDARRVQQVLPQRFARYGLTLHPEKTRLVAFAPRVQESKAQQKDDDDQDNEPPAQGPKRESRSFDFLGFTHHWGRSRKGKPVVQRSTMSKRLTRALVSLRAWLRQHLHDPVREQWRKLKAKGEKGSGVSCFKIPMIFDQCSSKVLKLRMITATAASFPPVTAGTGDRSFAFDTSLRLTSTTSGSKAAPATAKTGWQYTFDEPGFRS